MFFKRAFVLATVGHRKVHRYNANVPSLEALINGNANPMLFKAVFKIDYEVFRLLVQWIRQKPPKPGMEETPLFRWLRKHRKDSVSLATAVACCVLYLFGRGSLNEKAALMGMHKSSYDKTAKKVIAELVSRSNEVIYFPPKAEQVFLQTRRVRKPFPGGLFAIDGTLCRCTEKGRRNDFFCRKGYACINVQVVCDWNKNLVHVDSNYTGRTQDNDMFMGSPLQAWLDGENSPLRPGGFILGDEGYANCGSIMRPFTDRDRDSGHRLFNLMYKSARLIVENAIGGWKQKCPLLNIGLHAKHPEDLAVTVHASAVLYQFCKRAEEKLLNPSPPEYLNQVFITPEFLLTEGDTMEKRRRLVEYFKRHYPRAHQTLRVMMNTRG